MNRYYRAMLFGAFMILSGSCLAEQCHYISAQERWPIKTSISPQAELADSTTVDVQALIDLANPQLTRPQRQALQDQRLARPVRIGGRAFHEGDIVAVEGYVYRVHCEHDGDYHIEVGSTPARSRRGCLIVEIPDPGQIVTADLMRQVAAARSKVDEQAHQWQLHHQQVLIVGQLFLDESHTQAAAPGGGRGAGHCARHLWEVHPVTGIGAVSETARR